MIEGRDAEPRNLTGQTGSTRYMSPEVALSQPYGAEADVFSFATILWQIIAHQRPFSGMNVAAFEERVAKGGERPPPNSRWPTTLKQLLAECWQADPAERPAFSQLVPRLEAILQEVTPEGKVQRSRALSQTSPRAPMCSTSPSV
mmetsp:Transcript_78542/g.235439  ORF Transcript_78542/g.235439 Transcript_78542/m.235439 type:complete len:145 (-) Transcript_78542:89-523(-)